MTTEQDSQMPEVSRAIINVIKHYLKRPQDLDDDDTLPFVHIHSVREHIRAPNTGTEGVIPIGIVDAFSFDFRDYPTLIERSDHFAWYISETQVKEMSRFWQDTLHRLLCTWAHCKFPRTASTNKVRCILRNLEGWDGFELDAVPGPIDPPEESEPDPEPSEKPTTAMDINNSIRAITSLFQNNKLTGEETEPFVHNLQPILDQMEVSQIPFSHRVSALYSVLDKKARNVASKLNIKTMTIDEFVEALKKDLLYEQNIRERKKHRWNQITYSKFRSAAQTEDKATRGCIDYLKAHQKDLSPYLLTDEALLERLRTIFRRQPWCKSLYERSSAGMSADTFADMLTNAAANADEARRSNQTSTGTYPVNTSADLRDPIQTANSTLVAAFFAKTPPPPRHRRPNRYRRNFRSRYNPRYGNYGRNNHRLPAVLNRNMVRRRCYGCNQEGHILRNCTEREKHMKRFHFIESIGTAAQMLIAAVDQEPNEDLDSVATYLADFEQLDGLEEDTSEFDTLICDLLDAYDNSSSSLPTHVGDSTNSYFIRESLTELQAAMSELSVHSLFKITHHMLVDTGAPKSICTEMWLNQANWIPYKRIELPSNIKPFRFAGTPVVPNSVACLVAKITDIQGNEQLLRQVVFILPDTPIPFLVGLQTQRQLSFDICLRQMDASHLKINAWDKLIPLVVNSHVWMHFDPISEDPDPKFDWDPLIKSALDMSDHRTNACFENHYPTLDITSGHAIPIHIIGQDSKDSDFYPIPPWQRDDWKSKTTPDNIARLHEALRHPTKESMLELYRQQHEGRKLPRALREQIANQRCRPCAEHVQLPRKPKVALPPPATPNVAVTLDVMPHHVDNTKCNILVMLDAGDMMLRLSNLVDDTARTGFNAYLSRWMSIFDAPTFTIVDRGTNLTNEHMASSLRSLESQLWPIPTEAPWCLGNNERSHRFLHDATDKLLATPGFDRGEHNERLLAKVEMAWNFTQHTNRVIPHFYRFGIMPKVLGETTDPQTVQTRISLMEMARISTERLRANQVITEILESPRRQLLKLTLFNIGQQVWFHRRKYGWRVGTVSKIDRPTIYVAHDSKLYPTHETRVRPYFGVFSLPPEIRDHDSPEAELLERPSMPPHSSDANETNQQTEQQFDRAPISELLNGIFVTTEIAQQQTPIIRTDDNVLVLELPESDLGIIDSNVVLLTTVEEIKNLAKIPETDQVAFKSAKLEEIKFMIEEAVVKLASESEIPTECELQPLKWVLIIKRSPNADPPVRHRARLVSASHLSKFRHSVNGNAPTVALNTVRALFAIAQTWKNELQDQGDDLTIFARDVTKAYLQSKPTERLTYYQPPPEFYEAFPDKKGQVWQANVQIYGDTEAGRCWSKTVIPWYCNNILDYRQSIYDPSMLRSPTKPAATLLCTDDAINALPKSEEHQESKITERFKCRNRQETPTDFKGLDIKQEGNQLILSQTSYLKTVTINRSLNKLTKEETKRVMTDDEISQLRSDAGKLAWISTGTSPLTACAASVALQRNKEQKTPTVSLLNSTRKTLLNAQENNLAELRYVPLDNESIHIRVYSDGAFQKLTAKHSQLGFLVALCDKMDQFNLIHWYSSRAHRRPASTEQSELLALDLALRCIENLRVIIFQLLRREVPIILYVDNQSLWGNLMKGTVPCIPEVGYRCREPIHNGIITSTCLIPETDNPADAMTKMKPNAKLASAIRSNICTTPAKKAFMLQDCKYRGLSWIPKATVPMPSDKLSLVYLQ